MLGYADSYNELFSSMLQNDNWEQLKNAFVKSLSPTRDLSCPKGDTSFLSDIDLSALCIRAVPQIQNGSERFRACASSENPLTRTIKDLERFHNDQDIFYKGRLY